MNKCTNCGTFADERAQFCPLCNTQVCETEKSDRAYPDYKETYEVIRTSKLKRVLLFFSIVAACICFFINLLTLQSAPMLWSVIVIAGVLCGWFFLQSFRSQKLILPGKILTCYLAVAILLFVIDFSTGWHMWSTSYLIPFLTIAVVLLTTIFALTHKTDRYKDYMGYILATLFISIIPLVLFLFSQSYVMWTSIAALAYALGTVIGFYIFSPQGVKSEFKRRFHF